MSWFRPGPQRIRPRQRPGGIVAHVYGEDGRMLHVVDMGATDDLEAMATRDVDIVVSKLLPGEALCLVFYDGDTGERVTPLGRGLA